MARAVVDPNVLVSSRVSDMGFPARIARAADEGRFEVILSERLLEELSDVLIRPRFRRYATEEAVEEFLSGLREKGTFFEDIEAERLVPDDYASISASQLVSFLSVGGIRRRRRDHGQMLFVHHERVAFMRRLRRPRFLADWLKC